jgi:hypothetical protein
VSENGDGSPDDTSTAGGPVPRLTIGQRVLASLPNLQREPRTTAPPGSGRRQPVAGTDDDTGTAITPDEVLAPGSGPTPRGRFADAFLKPPQAARPRGAPSGMTKDELTHIIKRIDDREQRTAWLGAALGLVVGLTLTIAAVHFNPPPHHKGHLSTTFIVFFEGGARVLLSGVVALAAQNRRRSFVAFALLFLGTSMGPLYALPFWAIGIWLIVRVLKWQRELAAMTGGQTRPRADAGARGRDAAEARRRARNERMNARTAGGRRNKKQPEPTGPAPNKRYTPPKPPRPRPPAL